MLKVLIGAYQASPAEGSERSTGWHLPTALAARGVEVHVITDEVWRAEIEAEGPRDGLTFHYVDGAPPQGCRSGRRRVYAAYLAWQRRCHEAALALDAEHDFDVVHHLTWGSLFWGSSLARLDKPFVFGPLGGGQTSPEVLRQWFGASWRLEAGRNGALKHLLRFNPRARRTIRTADLVLVTNTETAERCRALGASRVVLCLDNAIVPEVIVQEERSAPPPNAPTVLWVGRNIPRKGVGLALSAFATVRRSVPSARLVMLGGGLDDADTTARIEALDLVGSVHRLGQVPLPTVIEYYDTSSVLLFSSLRESFGVQVLEAMARGLPVVALDVHGVSDFMPPAAGVKVPLQRGEGLADALGVGVVALLADPERWQRASDAGRAAAAEHTWDNLADELVGHFGRLAFRENGPVSLGRVGNVVPEDLLTQSTGRSTAGVPELARKAVRLVRVPRDRVCQWRLSRVLAPTRTPQVLSGPFQGMHFTTEVSWGTWYPYVLGTYEKELWDVVEYLISLRPRRLVEIGSAEGYYAAGFALRIPNCIVYASDVDGHARRICGRLAKMNGVDAQLEIEGPLSTERLCALVGDESVLVLDCEGCEAELLDPVRVPQLARTTILVELHDFIDPLIARGLSQGFSATHHVLECYSRTRLDSEYPGPRVGWILRRMAMNEHRPTRPHPMRWWLMVPNERVPPTLEGFSPV